MIKNLNIHQGLEDLDLLVAWTIQVPKGCKSSNFVTILMKRTRLLNLKKDMFRQLLCHRQFTDGITMMNNI